MTANINTKGLVAAVKRVSDFFGIPQLRQKQPTSKRVGNWIQTYTGVKFYPLDPRKEEIYIADIAHALSNKCRFTGHTSRFYSVAEHSVYVSQICSPKNALWGLLHDASEAYLADLAKPIKVLPEFRTFVEIENRIQRVVCDHFQLSSEEPEEVRVADRVCLITEKRDLMSHVDWDQFPYTEKPMEHKIKGMLPDEAREFFINRFFELTKSQ